MMFDIVSASGVNIFIKHSPSQCLLDIHDQIHVQVVGHHKTDNRLDYIVPSYVEGIVSVCFPLCAFSSLTTALIRLYINSLIE